MNFLAHAYLSEQDPALMTGNFMGDFVKGDPYQKLPDTMALGVLLHRSIDEFTDTHSIVKSSKKRLWSKYRHYAAVIVDILYDHFLARHFDRYSQVPLAHFAQWVYQSLDHHAAHLPKRTRHMLPYMEKANWLFHYQSIWGVGQALQGMARRSKFDSKMDEAIVDLEQNYDDFEAEFFEFFPLLQIHCKGFLRSHQYDGSKS